MRHLRNVTIAAIVIGWLSVLPTFLACGPKHIRTTAIFSEELGSSALIAQRAVTDLHDRGGMTDASYREWQTGFLKLGLGIKALNQGLRKANDAAVLTQVAALVGVVNGLIAAEVPKLRPADQALVMVGLASLRTVLLSIAATWGQP